MAQSIRLTNSNYTDDEPNAVSYELRNNIAIITLNRPQRKNAVDGPTAQKLNQAFSNFENDADAKVAVLFGANGVFCAGADLHEVSKIGNSDGNGKAHIVGPVDGSNNNIGPMGPSRRAINKPVIAAVAGHAVAGGLELSLLCDMRVCETDSIFGVFCRRWGVPLIDGGTVRLPHLIGLSRALDMILTGRPVRAQEALQFGLANRVVAKGQALNEAIALATLISKFPQQCMNVDRASAYNSIYAATSQQDALSFEYENGKHIIERESVAGATRFSREKAGRGGDFSLFTANQTAGRSNGQTYEAAQTARSHERQKHFGIEVQQSQKQSTSSARPIKAVFFDLGGVVIGSPIHSIIKYERSLGLNKFEINKLMAASQHWNDLECGRIELHEFYERFQRELNDNGLSRASIVEVFKLMDSTGSQRKEMIQTLKRLRAAGYKLCAITNNWLPPKGDSLSGNITELKQVFDHIVESCREKCRKPGEKLFNIACERTGVTADESAFLDDIGRNCIAAAKLGFTTIKVNADYVDALKQLQYALDERGAYKVDLGFGATPHKKPKENDRQQSKL